MKNILKIVAVAAVAVALTQTVQAVPISGNIGFSGGATLNSGTVGGATKVTSWGTNTVISESGSFAGLVSAGMQVLMTGSTWNFNSGALNNFWQVGGFTFNLTSSSVFSDAGGFLNVVLLGNVVGNGFSLTQFNGSFQVADPSADGVTTFTERLSFNSVPDGGTTVVLLGMALSGLALAKRKLKA